MKIASKILIHHIEPYFEAFYSHRNRLLEIAKSRSVGSARGPGGRGWAVCRISKRAPQSGSVALWAHSAPRRASIEYFEPSTTRLKPPDSRNTRLREVICCNIGEVGRSGPGVTSPYSPSLMLLRTLIEITVLFAGTQEPTNDTRCSQ